MASPEKSLVVRDVNRSEEKESVLEQLYLVRSTQFREYSEKFNNFSTESMGLQRFERAAILKRISEWRVSFLAAIPTEQVGLSVFQVSEKEDEYKSLCNAADEILEDVKTFKLQDNLWEEEVTEGVGNLNTLASVYNTFCIEVFYYLRAHKFKRFPDEELFTKFPESKEEEVALVDRICELIFDEQEDGSIEWCNDLGDLFKPKRDLIKAFFSGCLAKNEELKDHNAEDIEVPSELVSSGFDLIKPFEKRRMKNLTMMIHSFEGMQKVYDERFGDKIFKLYAIKDLKILLDEFFVLQTEVEELFMGKNVYEELDSDLGERCDDVCQRLVEFFLKNKEIIEGAEDDSSKSKPYMETELMKSFQYGPHELWTPNQILQAMHFKAKGIKRLEAGVARMHRNLANLSNKEEAARNFLNNSVIPYFQQILVTPGISKEFGFVVPRKAGQTSWASGEHVEQGGLAGDKLAEEGELEPLEEETSKQGASEEEEATPAEADTSEEDAEEKDEKEPEAESDTKEAEDEEEATAEPESKEDEGEEKPEEEGTQEEEVPPTDENEDDESEPGAFGEEYAAPTKPEEGGSPRKKVSKAKIAVRTMVGLVFIGALTGTGVLVNNFMKDGDDEEDVLASGDPKTEEPGEKGATDSSTASSDPDSKKEDPLAAEPEELTTTELEVLSEEALFSEVEISNGDGACKISIGVITYGENGKVLLFNKQGEILEGEQTVVFDKYGEEGPKEVVAIVNALNIRERAGSAVGLIELDVMGKPMKKMLILSLPK